VDIGNPYIDESNDGYFLRTFCSDLDPDELYWHKDRNNRLIEVLSGKGWRLQFDNELPITLTESCKYLIPKETFHRLILGVGDLQLKIIEY
jgi:hypothetical protein